MVCVLYFALGTEKSRAAVEYFWNGETVSFPLFRTHVG